MLNLNTYELESIHRQAVIILRGKQHTKVLGELLATCNSIDKTILSIVESINPNYIGDYSRDEVLNAIAIRLSIITMQAGLKL